MATIEFRTLGGVDLRDPQGERAIGSLLAKPKRLALLAYLSLARPRGFHRRDTLVGIFWPETSQARARNALSQALHVLRSELGEGVVATRGAEEVGLAPKEVWCDAVAFEGRLDGGEWATALDLYRGDLLPGFFLSYCPEFERWLENERARLHGRALQAALSLAEERQAAGDSAGAVSWLSRAAALAPYDEALLRQRIEFLLGLGDAASAVRIHDEFAARLAADLELAPSPEILSLVEGARDARGAPATAWRGRASPAIREDRAFARSRRPLAVSASVALALAVLLGGLAVDRSDPHPPPLDAGRVLVVPFRNETGDSSLDPLGRMAADWITEGLARTGLVHVVPSAAVLEGTGADEDPASLRALVNETGAGIVIEGWFYAHHDSIAFHGRVTDATTGEILRTIIPVAAPAAAPFEALEPLRRRTIGALAAQLDPRLSSWARLASEPPTYEAYRLYVEALEAFTADRKGEALSAFLDAAASDSMFTAPLVWAAYVEIETGRFSHTDSLLRVLELRRGWLAPWDHAMMDYEIAYIRGSGEDRYRTARKLAELAPGSEWDYLLGAVALWGNRPREAVRILGRLDPNRGWIRGFVWYWTALLNAHHGVGDFAGELTAARRLAERSGSEEMAGRRHELFALAALGREREIKDRLDAWPSPPPPGLLLARVAYEFRRHGHRAAGERMLERGLARLAADSARAATVLEGRNLEWHRFEYAGALFAAGRLAEARRMLEALVAGRPDDWNYLGQLGVVAAREGRREEAERLAAWLQAHQDPWDTGEIPVWLAAIAAQLGDREQAVQQLRRAEAEGLFFGRDLHARVDLEPLWDYEPYRAWVRPRG